MLNALKNQLAELAKDEELFKQKVKQHAPKAYSEKVVNHLHNLILTMPELISLISTWVHDTDMPNPVKKLNGYLLTYLYNPYDFIPDQNNGLFGYLDDAYFVGRIFIKTINFTDYSKRHSFEKLDSLAKDVPVWMASAKKVLPKISKNIDQAIDSLVEGNTEKFDKLISGSE
ncbi:MAG: hypothetical protein ACP5FK_04450 [bacterium]